MNRAASVLFSFVLLAGCAASTEGEDGVESGEDAITARPQITISSQDDEEALPARLHALLDTFKNDPDRFVLQGVHMILDGDHQRPWKDGEKRDSKLVFIGRELPEEKIRKGFESCIA